jgi:hypothetical protein
MASAYAAHLQGMPRKHQLRSHVAASLHAPPLLLLPLLLPAQLPAASATPERACWQQQLVRLLQVLLEPLLLQQLLEHQPAGRRQPKHRHAEGRLVQTLLLVQNSHNNGWFQARVL